jgi:hypothetical protein
MFKKTLAAIAVSSSILLLSCSDSSTNAPPKAVGADVTSDLQKVANVVENLAMLDKSEKLPQNSLPKKNTITSDTCYSLGTGIQVCTFSDAEGQYIDTSYTYAMDGVTLVDDDGLLNSYKQHVKSHSTSPLFNTSVEFDLSIKFDLNLADPMDFDMEFTMNGSGIVDYFNDDLILNFSKIFCKSNMTSCSYDYRFSMLDGKYNVTLTGDVSMDYENEPADSSMSASGPVILVSTGEKVGTFQMLYDGAIRILDNDGVIIKKTK